MTNNKQQTPLEWFIEELEYKGDLRETPAIRNIQLNIDTSDYMELKVQAKEMEEEKLDVAYGNGYEQGEMDFYKKMQVKGNQYADGYADGYAEGYKRALEVMEWYIKNHISGMPSPNAYIKDKDDEQSIIDYNKMEEESEMDNYNEMKDEQDKIN
jgi:hypothetical protein